jgi:formylmethanofuran dehydrogenase subunit E
MDAKIRRKGERAMTKKIDEALATLSRVVPTRFQSEVAVVKAEIEHLCGVISRLRCESCGDELGNTWSEINGIALCKDCSEWEL